MFSKQGNNFDDNLVRKISHLRTVTNLHISERENEKKSEIPPLEVDSRYASLTFSLGKLLCRGVHNYILISKFHLSV